MHPIVIVAMLEVVIIAAILIFTPLLTHVNPSSKPSAPSVSPVINPILSTNPTPAEAVLTYSKTIQKTTLTPPAGIHFLGEIERYVLTLTNAERHKKRLTALKHDPMLQIAARVHSVDMLENNFFDHVSPEGRTSHDRIAIVHRQLIGLTGENIWQAQGYDVNNAKQIAELAVDSWMKSPGHRENILRKTYTHLGVGATVKGDMIKLTQNFASTQATFTNPLPPKITSGNYLPLATIPGLQKYAPTKYAFWLANQGRLAAPPVLIKNNQVTVDSGNYHLRLYFVSARKRSRVEYIIYDGPQIVVE